MQLPRELQRWLLAGDPAVAWQVQRDLLGRARSTWEATRRRVAREGWGARLLARCCDGCWDSGWRTADGTVSTRRAASKRGTPRSTPRSACSRRSTLWRVRGEDSTRREASVRAREFFLEHQLYRSSTTGQVVRPSFAMFSFPPRWYFDVLRGLEHFAAVDAPWDERLSDPVDVLLRRRGKDGCWRAQNFHSGRTWFRLEPARSPSRINTLRALRVTQWLERARPGWTLPESPTSVFAASA